MKESLCILFTSVLEERKLSFVAAAKVSGMSKTQINNIVNHSGREVSLERVLSGLTNLGYRVQISLEED